MFFFDIADALRTASFKAETYRTGTMDQQMAVRKLLHLVRKTTDSDRGRTLRYAIIAVKRATQGSSLQQSCVETVLELSQSMASTQPIKAIQAATFVAQLDHIDRDKKEAAIELIRSLLDTVVKLDHGGAYYAAKVASRQLPLGDLRRREIDQFMIRNDRYLSHSPKEVPYRYPYRDLYEPKPDNMSPRPRSGAASRHSGHRFSPG